MIYTIRTFPVEYLLEEANFCLVGIPWDSTETGKSVKHGPLFIRESLKGLPGDDPGTGKNVFESKFTDLGDVEIVPGNWSLTRERILDTVDYIFKKNAKVFPIFLGGDHLITLATLEALKKQHNELTVVHFDAHADVSSEWMGEKYSHITWGYHAVKNLGVKLVQLGVRSWTNEEEKLREELMIKNSLEGIGGKVYITVDMDVFDPGFAPEVGTPEPMGMDPKEFFSLLKKVCENKIVGMDIVECSSTKVGTPTALLGAQIIKKVVVWKKE